MTGPARGADSTDSTDPPGPAAAAAADRPAPAAPGHRPAGPAPATDGPHPLPPETPAPRGHGRRHGRWAVRRLAGVVVPVLAVALWQAASVAGVLSVDLLPPPSQVGAALVDFFLGDREVRLPGITPFSGAGAEAVAASVVRWATAYALAVLVGIPVGMAVGLSTPLAALLDPLVQGLRAIPIFAWLPLAVVWFGLGEDAARFLVFIGAVFPILVATADAAARVPAAYVETARMLGTPRSQLWRRVYLPAAGPGIVTGLRLGLSLGWMSVIVGELTGARTGVGAMMTAAREAGRLDQVIVGMICFAALGLAGDVLLRLATHRAVRWSAR